MHTHSPARQKWQQQIARLWPAAKGSLAQIYKPCIRQDCPACARGDKHPAWVFCFSWQGRRRLVYVPRALVPQLQKAIRNGRHIEKLLSRNGRELVKAYRRSRKTAQNTPTKS